MFNLTPKPEEVFTPKAPTINEKMYVDRSELENRLKELISGSKHIIVHGESGNGKTWLYKNVFSETKTPYSVVNLGNASRLGSISAAITEKINRSKGDDRVLSQIVVSGGVEFLPGGVGLKGAKEWLYEAVEREPYDAMMRLIRSSEKSKKGILVLDNFETILQNAALVKELADMIILLDDDDYAEHDVKLCIVGVPTNIRDYLSTANASQSLANRLSELPEVARMSVDEARSLLTRGLRDLLKINISDSVIDDISWSTDRIAQYLHELGLEVARVALRNDATAEGEEFRMAEELWFNQNFSAARETLEQNLNARETKRGRRNQVIYSLGIIQIEDFKYTDVEKLVRKEFPQSTQGITLNVTQRLGELEGGTHPMIKRIPRGDAYRVIDPKIKIAARVMLQKVDGRVERSSNYRG
ncbi:AAA family ATPase [Pseudoroseicyclus sp. CXY001]|uniref:AAA family ATPase n=1 Tax=Pseudoroseicyclus sp. CXY001 TaxID=3242492 RepID=UPI0035709CB6